jgi:hypothetical protein
MVGLTCNPSYAGDTGKNVKTLSEKKLKQKGLEVRLKWYITCQASARPRIQTLVLQKPK